MDNKMEDKSKCCDTNDDKRHSFRRPHAIKRQDSWMEFKGRIFRMASTVVLPKNKRICPRSLEPPESVRLKSTTTSMSVKSLPQIQREEDEETRQKQPFYTRSISVQDDSREMKSKKVLFAPQALPISEVEEVDSCASSISFDPNVAVQCWTDNRYDSPDMDQAMSLERQKKSKGMSMFRLGTTSKSADTSAENISKVSALVSASRKFHHSSMQRSIVPMHYLKKDFPPSDTSSKKSMYSEEHHHENLSRESRDQEENVLMEPSPAKGEEDNSESDSEYDKDDADFSLTLAYHDFYSCMPPPIFMLCITLTEIGFFAYHSKLLIDEYGRINKFSPAPLDSVLIYNPTKRYEVWRYFTYALVHSGYMHIINNIAIQLVLGILLEMVHQWWRVLAIYFAGILAGSLATSITQPFNFLAGASAGVYALIAAHLSTVILNWTEMERPWIRIFIFLAFLLHDGGTAIYYGYVLGEKTNVGYAAHLGGAVAGLLVGIHVLKNLQWKEWEKVLWWFCLVVCALLLFFAVGWNIFRTDLFP